jgi:hypothetical protein
MDNAWIAVLGTLAGVAITATSSLFGIWLTGRNQRLTAEQQLRSAAAERLRNERRSICIDYLTAYSNFREAILSAHQRHLETNAIGARTPKPVEYAPDAAAEFSRAHHALQITFGEPIADLERKCNVDIWNLGDNYSAEGEEFDRMWSAARSSRLELHRAMRADLQS